MITNQEQIAFMVLYQPNENNWKDDKEVITTVNNWSDVGIDSVVTIAGVIALKAIFRDTTVRKDPFALGFAILATLSGIFQIP